MKLFAHIMNVLTIGGIIYFILYLIDIFILKK